MERQYFSKVWAYILLLDVPTYPRDKFSSRYNHGQFGNAFSYLLLLLFFFFPFRNSSLWFSVKVWATNQFLLFIGWFLEATFEVLWKSASACWSCISKTIHNCFHNWSHDMFTGHETASYNRFTIWLPNTNTITSTVRDSTLWIYFVARYSGQIIYHG